MRGYTATESDVSVSFKNTDPVASFCAISPLVIDFADACEQPRPYCDNSKEKYGGGGGRRAGAMVTKNLCSADLPCSAMLLFFSSQELMK